MSRTFLQRLLIRHCNRPSLAEPQENKRLSEPLTVALTDVAELHAHLRGQEKDRMSLANAKARLRVIDEQVCLRNRNFLVELGDGI